jgi:8-oxo-dGTP pyrophosphatase MutT (NUDIX family)
LTFSLSQHQEHYTHPTANVYPSHHRFTRPSDTARQGPATARITASGKPDRTARHDDWAGVEVDLVVQGRQERTGSEATDRTTPARILLAQRADTLNWELPGGKVEFGESAIDAAVREVAEETGVMIEVTGLSGVYTDPGHVMVYPTGEVRQQFALCLHARAVSGDPHPDRDEMVNAAWIAVDDILSLPIHPSMRLRIDHALTHPSEVLLI